MSETLYRAFSVRGTDEERTVVGLAAPYGEVITHDGQKETFERGAFSAVEAGKPLFYQHDHLNGGMPIGVITDVNDTEAGLEIKARFSETPKGTEVYTLVRDGALKSFSVGFVPEAHKQDGDVTVWTRASLKEVSVVLEPAYSKAAIAEVRNADTNNSKENKMTESTNSEVVELREAVDNLERKYNVLSAGTSPVVQNTPKFRSAGEALKALATDDEARSLYRAYTGSTSADTVVKNVIVPSRVAFALQNRLVMQFFSKGTLPESGNSVEYVVRGTATGAVAAQAAEGDDATFLKTTLTTATAPIKTYHGYGQLTRQEIERATVSNLETTLEFMGTSYANVTNAAVRTAFTAVASPAGTGTMTLATAKGADFLGLLHDASAAIEDASFGLGVDAVIMSRNVYRRLTTLADTTERPLFNVQGAGVNTPGSLTVVGAKGYLVTTPIIVDPGLATNSLFFASTEAVRSWESAGAPFALTDENIINLSKDFALYGYMATAVVEPKGIFKVTVT